METTRDIVANDIAGIQIDFDGKKLWVCVDGACVLRVVAPLIELEDMRLTLKRKPEPEPLPAEYVSADDAATMLNLSKRTFLNLSTRGDIKGQKVYQGKKVWEREVIEKLAKQLSQEF